MESRIPVPTDNIFKFYALFGLLLFVFSCGALLFVNSSTNSFLSSAYTELEGLKQLENPSRVEKARIDILERKMDVSKSDKGFFSSALAVLGVGAISGMGYGFLKWHTVVQPVLDESAKVQLEIAKLQLTQLQRELGISEGAAPVAAKPAAADSTPKEAQASTD